MGGLEVSDLVRTDLATRLQRCAARRRGRNRTGGKLQGIAGRLRQTVDLRVAGRKDGLIPGVQPRARDQFSDAGSRPGGGFAILTRWRRILSTCGGL